MAMKPFENNKYILLFFYNRILPTAIHEPYREIGMVGLILENPSRTPILTILRKKEYKKKSQFSNIL